MPSDSYPHLRDLLGGWFHQDYDLAGDTLVEIVGAYRATAKAAERDAVKRDIEAFLRDGEGDTDALFQATFQPDVDPRGWGLTTYDWLDRIRALL